MKKEVRILGIDDSSFSKFDDEKVLVIGVVFRGGEYIDGVLSTHITVDELDSTYRLIEMVNKSRNKDQLQYIMTDGIALGGFNVIDINKLYEETNLPVIVIIRRKPDFDSIYSALENLKHKEKIKELLDRAGKLESFESIYFQCAGIDSEEAKKLLKMTIKHGLIPEPIRVAHIIAQGIGLGESKGRA